MKLYVITEDEGDYINEIYWTLDRAKAEFAIEQVRPYARELNIEERELDQFRMGSKLYAVKYQIHNVYGPWLDVTELTANPDDIMKMPDRRLVSIEEIVTEKRAET